MKRTIVTLILVLLVAQIAQARELPDPPQPAGYYQMEPGEVYELRCPTNPDNVQPAVNMVAMNGEWRVIVGCPEVIGSDANEPSKSDQRR